MKLFPSGLVGNIRLAVYVCILIGVSYAYNAQLLFYWLAYFPKDGDIVFQSLPHGQLVDAIEGVTHSPYSHCGVVLRKDGRWVVVEAIMDVHETPLFLWLLRGRNAGFAVYRLDRKYDSIIPEFKKRVISYEGLPYDFDYTLADDKMYCSELAYKAFLKTTGEELGKLEKLSDLDWKPFAGYIRSIQADKLPLDRVMITPASLSRAKQVKEIFRAGL